MSRRTTRRADERQMKHGLKRQQRRAARTSSQPLPFAEAVRQHEGQFLGPALMARHLARQKSALDNPSLLPPQFWSVIAMTALADGTLCKLGCRWSLAPDVWGQRDWMEHLRWGLDRVADAGRMLRCGDTFGAAVVARGQLERWTYNVAQHHGVHPVDHEGTADYFRRVWSVYPPLAAQVDVGKSWLDLSEGMHGRGPLVKALEGPVRASDSVLDVQTGPLTAVVHRDIAAVLSLIDRQIRGGISVLAEDAGLPTEAHALQGMIGPPNHPIDVSPVRALRPLDFLHIASSDASDVVFEAERYRRSVLDPENMRLLSLGSGWDTANSSFLERRARAIQRARGAFRTEQEIRGEDFDPGQLGARLFRYIAIGEMSSIVASWTDGPAGEALLTASSALRSGWIFWLEDTDLSMPCTRTVLEQTCRARAWRIKPARAVRVEAAGAVVAPVRWVEAAGYGRLSALSRALGEFSHINVRARWTGARGILEEMQSDEAQQDSATARGFALDSASYLLAYEILSRLSSVTEDLARSFREEVTLLSEVEHEDRVNKLLDRSLGLRNRSLGKPDLTSAEDLLVDYE